MVDKERIISAMAEIINAIGEDPTREGLVDTPKRVADMFDEIFSGINEDPSKYFDTTFESDFKDSIIIKDIQFSSMCEHHFLPFYGKVHIAYIPKERRVLGLSKLVRLVNAFSRRPQLQERLTSQIARELMTNLRTEGVLVVIEAEHMCMSIRGVKQIGAKTITQASYGIFENDIKKRNEILSLLS